MPRIKLFQLGSLSLFLLLKGCPTQSSAQSGAPTPNVQLQIPSFNSVGWQNLLNADLVRVDNIFGGIVPVPAMQVGNLSVTGQLQAPNLQFTEQQIVTAIGYTPVKSDLSNITDPAQALVYLGGMPAQIPAAWSSSIAYGQYALVLAADGNTYISRQAVNTGNDPTAPGSAYWGKFAGGSTAAGSQGAVQVAGTNGVLAPATPLNITTALGYAPTNPANNGSDFVSPATTLTNLGGASTTALASTTAIASAALPKTGGTLTGPLTLSGDPTTATQASTRNYVDTSIAPVSTLATNAATQAGNANTTASAALTAAQNAIPIAGSSVYAAGTTYGKGTVAIYTDGNYYISLQANNTGNTPASGGTAYWASYIKPGAGSSAAGGANVVQANDGTGKLQGDAATTDNSLTHTFQVLQHVAKLPKIDVTHSDFGTAAGCANAADPTGNLDSTCAVQAALAYSVSQSHTMFGVSMGVYYPVYLPAGIYKINGTLAVYGGQALIGDARTVVTLKQTNGTATLVVLEVNPSYNGIGTSDTVIANLNLIGSGHLTRGSLLEINTPNIVLDNVQFSNTGGREQQINNAERITTLNPTYSYGRWPVVLAGDVNESYFYNVHLTYAQQTNEPSPSGSKYGNWCYGVNCITTPTSNASATTGSNYAGTTGTVGTLPAGNSSSATPNPLYADPYCAIYIEKAINVGFYGGTDKNNYFNCGLRSASAGVTTVDHFYMEASTGATPYGPGNSAYITGGAANQTYLTGAPVLVSGTYNTSKGNLYSAPVADTSWQALFYGSTADAVSYWSGNYNPYVIVPQDYNPLSSTASAYATGVNQNQLERVLIAGFTADGHAIFARNQAGSSVPANYAWPAGSIIEDLASTSGSNSLTVSNSHMQNTQSSSGLEGNASSGYYQWTYAGQFPGGEIVSGVPGDTVAFNADPSLNKNGVNRGFNAPGDYGSGITRYLTLNNNEYFNAGNNKYAGSINAISSTDLTVLGYTNNPDSPFLANTASQAAALGRSLPLGNINGGGSVFAPLAGDGVTVTPVYFVAPNQGVVWDAKTGFLMQNGKEFNQSGGYRGGIQFQNEFSIFDSPTSGGQPNMELKMVTNNAGFGSFTFQAVSGGTNTPWAIINTSGLLCSIVPYTTVAAYTLPDYACYVQWDPGTTAGTFTLPKMATGKQFTVFIPATTTAAVTFKVPTAGPTIHASTGVSLTGSWGPAVSAGVYQFETDGSNYQLLTPIGINGQCTAPALPKFTNGIATSCQ